MWTLLADSSYSLYLEPGYSFIVWAPVHLVLAEPGSSAPNGGGKPPWVSAEYTAQREPDYEHLQWAPSVRVFHSQALRASSQEPWNRATLSPISLMGKWRL